MRSFSSEPLKDARLTPRPSITSFIVGPWFHIAAATRIGDPYRLR
jgi:hypothetical protein